MQVLRLRAARFAQDDTFKTGHFKTEDTSKEDTSKQKTVSSGDRLRRLLGMTD
jgi:hypothetical protein